MGAFSNRQPGYMFAPSLTLLSCCGGSLTWMDRIYRMGFTGDLGCRLQTVDACQVASPAFRRTNCFTEALSLKPASRSSRTTSGPTCAITFRCLASSNTPIRPIIEPAWLIDSSCPNLLQVRIQEKIHHPLTLETPRHGEEFARRMALPAPRNPSVERISHRAGTLWKMVWVISKLRPYEKFVQRLRGSEEEAGQGEEVTVVRLLVVGEKKA